MAYEFKLPDIGEGIHEGEIAKWFVNKGDEIKEDDVLCEVQNDKAVVEIPSPVEGTVLEVLVDEGETAVVGDVIIKIDAEGYDSDDEEDTSDGEESEKESEQEESKDDSKQESKEEAKEESPKTDSTESDTDESEDKRVIAMPSVRKYARDNDVNISKFKVLVKMAAS